jgi:8-oxo-dGTP diphosphatase
VTASSTPIVVTAAVVERDGCYLVTRRLAGTHLAGAWEFPGGKCEAGEGHAACLERELREELGVGATVGPLVLETVHHYPGHTVALYFHRCELDGEPSPQLGQEMRWVRREDLRTMEFPEADAALIALLGR